MAKKKGGGGRKKLHGAAKAAHDKRMRREGHSYKKSGGGHRKRSRSRSGGGGGGHHTRRRRRNPPRTTFVQAVGKVLGGAAAMFGSGVITTVATAKIAPGHPLSLYGIPAGVALIGAGVATKMPIVGAGITAGAAAPFVLPVASQLLGGGAGMMAKPSTVSALRAVAMSGAYRQLNTSVRGVPNPLGNMMRGVSNPLGAVSMGTVYAD